MNRPLTKAVHAVEEFLADHQLCQFLRHPGVRLQLVFETDGMAREARMAYARSDEGVQNLIEAGATPPYGSRHGFRVDGLVLEFVGPHVTVRR